MKNKCKLDHGWAYLNKRFDEKELTIVAFCDECEYIDKKALKLQKALDKADRAYNKYKHDGVLCRHCSDKFKEVEGLLLNRLKSQEKKITNKQAYMIVKKSFNQYKKDRSKYEKLRIKDL